MDRDSEPSHPSSGSTHLSRIALVLIVAAAAALAQEHTPSSPQSGEQISVPGKPVLPDSGRVSEHNLQWLKTQPPQIQAEFLLEEAINHDRGATDLIPKYLEAWHGKLEWTHRWEDLESSALYSNDLRVRAAAIEINLVVNALDKADETATRLLESAEGDQSHRGWYEWELGMLANRGIETEKIYEALSNWAHDKDQQTRFWAVEDLAHIGSDETIKNLLDVLRNDPSMEVRERGGCSMAKSGMLTREQRMKAVPGLLELTDDPSLNEITRQWVYQALREITDEPLRNDPATWRNWYSTHGAEKVEQFKRAGSWALLGNN